jgi:DNA-binding NtrC family response regulator
VAEGTFRGDLYYRLAGDVIILPPLRERAEDYEPLINHLLDQKKEVLRRERGLEKIGLSAGAKNAIKRYHWPGNIRELDNVLMRVATHSDQVEIPGDDIRAALRLAPVEQEAPVLSRAFTENFSLDDVLDEVTRHYIERARVQLGGSLTKGVSITKAAKILGFKNYQTLSNRIDKLGIDWP